MTARRLVERMALTLQASLLVRHAPAAVADAFCATRLGGDWGHAFGTLPGGGGAGRDPGAGAARAGVRRGRRTALTCGHAVPDGDCQWWGAH